MELNIVVSGRTSPKKLVSDLEAAGFAVESPFEGHGFTDVDARTVFVRCHRSRSNVLVPVIAHDSEIDAKDLGDAVAIAAARQYSLRKHGHRPAPVASDEDVLRRLIGEELDIRGVH